LSTQLPERLASLDTQAMRQRLAGLIDKQVERKASGGDYDRELAIRFCASLPTVLGDSIDRLTMWNKIAAAITSAYAKTIGGDLDFFVQSVLDSVKADPSIAVASERLTGAIDMMDAMPAESRAGWLQYLATHLTPVLVHARRMHQTLSQAAKAERGTAQ
jgi:hypothetical protein